MRQYIDTTQDAAGNAIVGATVEVDLIPGSTKASLFSDNGLTALANPVTSDSTGQFSFFVADGDYSLVFKYNGTTYKTQSPVSIFDGASQVTITDSGSANAYAISSSALEKALRTGLRCWFNAAHTNTGASTLAYNGLTAKAIRYEDNTALVAGAIVSGGIYGCEYDGTVWRLQNSTQFPSQVTLSTAYIPTSPPATSGTNTYTATTNPSFASLTTGAIYPINIGTTNTSSTVTLNLNGIGAKTVYMSDGAAVPPIGYLVSGVTYFLYYNGTAFSIISNADVTGSFTITLTGMTSTVTGTVYYRVTGNEVNCWTTAVINGTSNTTAMTGTGIPSILQPLTGKYIPVYVQNGSSYAIGLISTGTSSTWTFGITAANFTFTSSGSKGLYPSTFTYTLD